MPEAGEFSRVESALSQGGVRQSLEVLADYLLTQGRFHELYRARKMQVRDRLGLTLLDDDPREVLSDDQRLKLEEELTLVCREIGGLLMRAGKTYDGWMFLRAAGAKELARQILDETPTTEDNREEMIEVALREGLDVPRGFALVLDSFGCCNAITTFDAEISRHSPADRQAAAAILVRALHRDLLASVTRDIARQEGQTPQDNRLGALVAERPWLFGEMSYHIDTTHLASVVRFARQLRDPELLRAAFDLTEYGRRLHKQFQYPGDEPFGEMYPASALFFRALLGEGVDEALSYFRNKAESLDSQQIGSAPAEVYIDLLSRTGRPREALLEALRLLGNENQLLGIAPSFLDLARQASDFQPIVDFCRERGDLLGFATALVVSRCDGRIPPP
jgi:hypothetical protein